MIWHVLLVLVLISFVDTPDALLFLFLDFGYLFI